MLIGTYKTCLFLILLKICNSHLSIIEPMAESSLSLTEGQLKVLDLVESGHNVCLVGKAGVGKSTVVLELKKRLSSKGKKCHIVCSSGVSCEPYNGVAKTVHSQYGLQTCELPKRLLLERALKKKTFSTILPTQTFLFGTRSQCVANEYLNLSIFSIIWYQRIPYLLVVFR